MKNSADLIILFNYLFENTENTILVGGAEEPLYLPADSDPLHTKHRIIFRKDYFVGYSNGLNPFLQVNPKSSEAFIYGFNSGRMDYENMNGYIVDGIPERIVTLKILEDFLLAGILGLSIETENYSSHQLSVISKWYQSGVEKYDPNESIYLFEILEQNGISMN